MGVHDKREAGRRYGVSLCTCVCLYLYVCVCVNSRARGVCLILVMADTPAALFHPFTSPPPAASPAHQESLTIKLMEGGHFKSSSPPCSFPHPVCLLFLFVRQTFISFLFSPFLIFKLFPSKRDATLSQTSVGKTKCY